MRNRSRALVALVVVSLGCVSDRPRGQTYLRWVAFEVPINENVLLRWPEERMPLRIHLPEAPVDFDDPEAVYDMVESGVLDWTDAAGPGVPTFVFVDDPGDADIPIVWESEPDGDWYIAHCAYQINPMQRRFGVARILVTARWRNGRVATLDEVHRTVLHEMGHALGLGGHSPYRGDIMYPNIDEAAGLSARDRATLAALYARPIGTRMPGARSER